MPNFGFAGMIEKSNAEGELSRFAVGFILARGLDNEFIEYISQIAANEARQAVAKVLAAPKQER